RQRKRRNALIFRSVLAGLLLVFSLGYIGLYAQVTLYGYRRAELGRQIRQIEMENQALEAEIQTLSSPERVSALAVQSGMKPRDDVVYISPSESISVALAR
ncbi:MAG TPA: hypothetical protein PKV43_05660, partial [Armatimonadota bacterium]|nr:hypothetical protein [Armatimonadota bacterium]